MTSTKRGRSPVKLVAGIAGGLLAILALVYGGSYWYANSGLPAGTNVAGVEVGRMSHEEGVAALQTGLTDQVAAPLVISAKDKSITKSPSELGLGVDFEASISQAGGAPGFDPRRILAALTGDRSFDAVVTMDSTVMNAALDELGQLVALDPVDATLTFDKKPKAVMTESALGLALDVEQTAEAAKNAFLKAETVDGVVQEKPPHISTEEATRVMNEVANPAIASDIKVIAEGKSAKLTPVMIAKSLSFLAEGNVLEPKLDADTLVAESSDAFGSLGLKEPKNASFKFVDGKPKVVASVDGRGVSAKDLVAAIEPVLTEPGKRSVEVPVSVQEAKFSTEDAKNSGVKEITGEFTTYFPASAYRVNNIGKSARLINGYFVAPGETFSLNKVLGPRTLARGWMAGGAIDGGKVVERMGGGISQTTTTLFNAVFFAGLEIVTHKPHSLYFSRYPVGREATLDYYSVDMKFRNDTKHGVLLQAFTNNPRVGGNGSITVRVWSTKTYKVKASEPVKSNFKSPGAPIKDNSKVCSPQSGMTGFRVDYKRLFYKGDKLVRSEPFTWTYNSLTPVECTNPDRRADRIER